MSKKTKKAAVGRKPTGRDIPIYPRVTAPQKKWLNEMVVSLKKSEAEIVDKVLQYARRNFLVSDMKELTSGKKTGNNLSGTTPKAA